MILLLIAALVFLADWQYGWSAWLSNTGNLQFLLEMVQENLWLALLIYTLLTIVGCVVLALPGITFAVFAGILFGPWLGTMVCLVATTIGAVLAFLVGRYFLHDSVKPLVMKNQWLKKVLFEDTDRRDMVILMITRLVPLFPYNLQNFAYGITDISFTRYSVLTFVFMLPGVALYTIGAAGLTAEEGKWKYFAAAAVLAVVVTITGMLIRKKYLGDETNEEE